MSKIVVKVSSLGNLKELRDNLHSKVQELIVDTINEAQAEADALINQAKSYADGNDAVDTTVTVNDLTAKLTMSGEDCLFVEYGAGDLTLFPYSPGEYSEKHAKQYSEKGYWYFDKTKYTGIPAYRPIFNATQKAWDYLEEHADEVFK